MADPIDLALAEPNPLILSALSDLFGRDSRFSLVATSATAEGLLAVALRVPLAVAVIDWKTPVIGAQRLAEVLREQPRPPRLVIYADDPAGDLPRRAMLAGAAGFVPRAAPAERLVETCLAVHAGQMVFPFLDVRELASDPMRSLTRREAAMLERLAEGLSNKELARAFELSENTVKFHLSNLYEKLGVSGRAQAIARWWRDR